MLSRRHRQALHPTLNLLAAGGQQWARDASRFVVCRLLGGLFLAVFLFSRAIMPPHLIRPGVRPLHIDASNNNDISKLMIITLEFRRGTFSGNGVYAQSIAQSLSRKGHEVMVISGKPVQNLSKDNHSMEINNSVDSMRFHYTQSTFDLNMLKKDPDTGLIELEVDVEHDGWGRLDWKCPWKSFAHGITVYADHVAAFDPTWVLVVDWSTVPAFESVSKAAKTELQMAFLNFRIYTMSEYQGENGEAEKQFYKDMESKAVSMASAVSALSSRDANILATELGAGIKPGVIPKPHFPPLREDLRMLALNSNYSNEWKNADMWPRRRKFFSSCVRISPEKNTELFAALVEVLADFLREQGIVPFLCGGAQAAGSYAENVKARVKTAMPESVIYEGFMGPAQLSGIYSQTLLNLHPCIYDAYGMTIVEAAAFASPSIVHVGRGGAVGAAEFLSPDLVPLDLTLPVVNIAEGIKGVLLNRSHLANVGIAASGRSLSWDEDANAEQLIDILKCAPKLPKRQ